MSQEERETFTLSDVRAIRYLVLGMGGLGGMMLVFTDPHTPLLVVGFITILTVVPIGTIYLWRRRARKNRPDQK